MAAMPRSRLATHSNAFGEVRPMDAKSLHLWDGVLQCLGDISNLEIRDWLPVFNHCHHVSVVTVMKGGRSQSSITGQWCGGRCRYRRHPRKSERWLGSRELR